MKKNFLGIAAAVIFLIGAFLPIFKASDSNNFYDVEVAYTVWGYSGKMLEKEHNVEIGFSAGYTGKVDVDVSDEKIAELDLESAIQDITETEGVDKRVLDYINILAYLMVVLGALLIAVAYFNNKALNIIFMLLSVIGILGLAFFMYVISIKETELGLKLSIGIGCYVMLAGLVLYLFSPKKRLR